MEFNLWHGFHDFLQEREESRRPRPPKALFSDASVGVLLRAWVVCKVRAYVARPRLHVGPALEWFDGVYALVLVAALLALAGWRA